MIGHIFISARSPTHKALHHPLIHYGGMEAHMVDILKVCEKTIKVKGKDGTRLPGCY